MSTEYKTLPDEPGLWLFWDEGYWLPFRVLRQKDHEGHWRKGVWLKLPDPDPPYPPKPRMVYGIYQDQYNPIPEWFCEKDNGYVRSISMGTVWHCSFLTVLPHPDNDPDLVREIEEAKKKP